MADLAKCRGCGELLLDCRELVVSIQFGTLESTESGTPSWVVKAPQKSTWGRMHERCFLLAIGDPRGVELASAAQ